MSVIKYPTSARNIIKAINGNMVSVTNAGLHYKGEDKSESITPEALISDLEFYSESGIFAKSIDFRQFRSGKEKFIIQAGNMSPYCDCSILVEVCANDGVTRDDVETQLREELFFQKSAQVLEKIIIQRYAFSEIRGQSSIVDDYLLDGNTFW